MYLKVEVQYLSKCTWLHSITGPNTLLFHMIKLKLFSNLLEQLKKRAADL